jgi:CheY-like chemotaxis protein
VAIAVSQRRVEDGIAVTFAVSDSGIGMSVDAAARIFDPFMHARGSPTRRFEGSGLGLVITRKIAQLMGGDVTIKTKHGQGLTATLTAIAEPPSGERASEVIPALGRRGDEAPSAKRILLVDDNPINRRVGRLFLEPQGYEVTEAENGLVALERLDDGDFDLILLDVHMPVLDGLQTLKRIRGANKPWSNLPVIALTADAMTGDREHLLAQGMCGYVAKPIELQNLLAEISRVVEQTVHVE